MANEFRHGTVGTALSQAEWESITGHAFASQATGDILYASSTTQLSRLAKGTDGDILNLASNIPAWTSTITTSKTLNDDISILFGTSGADADLKSDGTNLVLNLLATRHQNFFISRLIFLSLSVCWKRHSPRRSYNATRTDLCLNSTQRFLMSFISHSLWGTN